MKEKFPAVISVAANVKWKINPAALLEGREANCDHLLTFINSFCRTFRCALPEVLGGRLAVWKTLKTSEI